MEKIYIKLFELAKPYYKKGRSYDIPSIQWMMQQADKIADIENLDKKLLLPLIALHDVGYSKLKDKNPNVKHKEPKIMHMRVGAKIAEKILMQINYDEDYSKKIVHYVSVHDNWVLNDYSPYKECKEMAVFGDLDFMFPLADKSFLKARADGMGETIKENIQGFSNDKILKIRPLCCKATQALFNELIKKAKTY